ncbi:hypothetical protein PUNSTDRAFT_144569 [Punctularia strigosozonata HHB-11173 SS5]|uniref:uncharacterized protein n=1 Tax=Punctularia strigosozonata (strain HHB-11173) TaxID=741275 RepID=UPI0004417BDD|nr:uncharacterized protein PUNSTDRAFT_144569 [Punctularia strigosozonata HHB-11173 SS5]EIN06976.1 hypothetical protein PUNSTDRAFT_144569 [Punctularia strigosozonata HHB-11173 SS5]
MAKKKNKAVIRPWCWYCEREFEDEKVLMQHQKAKHFKCGMCPRRLNTAGGLAVHIQQVHKLEPDQLPRIENALPGRDGYEVEIFGMEGIPAPDVADYKRRKEIELGLAAGTISQPQAKKPKIEHRPLTEEELRAQLEAHKALMGANNDTSSAPTTSEAVYNAAPQTYAVPAAPAVPIPPPGASPPPGLPGMPPMLPPGMPPPGFMPGQPPFPPPFPLPGMPPLPPGMSPPPGFPLPPGMPPPGMLPPGAPPFPLPPGVMPPPPGVLPPGIGPPFSPPNAATPPRPPPPSAPTFVPAASAHAPKAPSPSAAPPAPPAQLTLPNPALAQTLPEFKKPTDLKWRDPNFSPDEQRANHPKYYFNKENAADVDGAAHEESRGKKRARAEDFL